jgi:hypothetical protein
MFLLLSIWPTIVSAGSCPDITLMFWPAVQKASPPNSLALPSRTWVWRLWARTASNVIMSRL